MSDKGTVLVTGASSGLGDQFCRTLAADGYTVIAAARRKDRLEALCSDITANGGTACALAMDVSDVESFAVAIGRSRSHGWADHLPRQQCWHFSKQVRD